MAALGPSEQAMDTARRAAKLVPALTTRPGSLRRRARARLRLRASIAALARGEERFRRMLDGGWDTVTVSDVEGRYLFVSGSSRRVLGYTPAETVALRGHDFVHPEDLELMVAARQRIRAEDGAGETVVHRVRHKDGHYVWLETNVVNLLRDPSVRGIMAISRDITARKHAEDELRRLNAELERRVAERTEALARAARAKDEFLASMSHELRTPLNGILGNGEVILAGVYGPISDAVRAAVTRSEESGRHLLALINDILDLAKVESGKLELALGAVDLDHLAHTSLRLVEEPARQKRIDLLLDAEFGLPPLLGDERRLKQVLVNLLTNAVKFTPEGGRVGLEIAVPAPHTVSLAVWDTGIGIAPEDHGRLFQPFVQLDARLSRQHAGTGLGLSLVRRLVELHGGTVEVQSAAGRGARFTVTLPHRLAPDARP
jgi:PAS domain S-box-containing protein